MGEGVADGEGVTLDVFDDDEADAGVERVSGEADGDGDGRVELVVVDGTAGDDDRAPAAAAPEGVGGAFFIPSANNQSNARSREPPLCDKA